MNTQQRMSSYESNMRVIGYLFNSIKDNYSEMSVEDFQSLTGEISRLFQTSADLLPSANVEPEPSSTPLSLERDLNDSNITMTRGNVTDSNDDFLRIDVTTRFLTSFAGDDDYPTDEELRENNLIRDTPEVVNLIEETSSTTSEDYEDYIRHKKKPRLTSKCFSIKDGREKTTECAICFEEYSLKNTLTLGCGHEFCKECVCEHFHFSVTNQPYKSFYACPTCRSDVKKVRVNYSKMDAKDKEDLMKNDMTYEIRTYCKP